MTTSAPPDPSGTPYTISEADYVACGKLYGRLSWKRWLCLLIIIGVILLWLYAQYRSVGMILSGIAGGMASFLLIIFVINPWAMRRQYRKHPMIQQPIFLQSATDGVRFSSSYGNTLLAWQHIHKWRQDDHYLLLYQSPRVFHPIPKRIADKGFDVDALIRQLTEQVGQPK